MEGARPARRDAASEDGQPGDEHPSTAGPPGYVARCEHTAGEGYDKAFHHPLDLAERGVEAPLHARQGDADGHEVRQDNERGQANGHERAPLAEIPRASRDPGRWPKSGQLSCCRMSSQCHK